MVEKFFQNKHFSRDVSLETTSAVRFPALQEIICASKISQSTGNCTRKNMVEKFFQNKHFSRDVSLETTSAVRFPASQEIICARKISQSTGNCTRNSNFEEKFRKNFQEAKYTLVGVKTHVKPRGRVATEHVLVLGRLSYMRACEVSKAWVNFAPVSSGRYAHL